MTGLDNWGAAVHAWADGQPGAIPLALVLEKVLDPWTYRVAVGLALVLGWRRRPRRTSLVVGSAVVLGGLAGVGLKELVKRPRPSWQEVASYAPGYSLPSGHALNSALGAGLLLVLAWPYLRTRRARVLAVTAAVLLVGLTGADRVVLGVHYPTDVLAGWAVGAGIAGLAWLLTRGDGQTRPPERPGQGASDPDPGARRGP